MSDHVLSLFICSVNSNYTSMVIFFRVSKHPHSLPRRFESELLTHISSPEGLRRYGVSPAINSTPDSLIIFHPFSRGFTSLTIEKTSLTVFKLYRPCTSHFSPDRSQLLTFYLDNSLHRRTNVARYKVRSKTEMRKPFFTLR